MLLGRGRFSPLKVNEDDIGSIPGKNDDIEINVFCKAEYDKIIRDKRSRFIHNYFKGEVDSIFYNLRILAEKGKICNYEATFMVPDHLNIENTSSIIKNYFNDFGYNTIIEIIDIEKSLIVITIK